MTSPSTSPSLPSQRGEPAWEVALLLPAQGEWTEAQYLALGTNRLVELSDGCLEVLPMPTIAHQLIVKFLFGLLDSFVTARRLGMVLFAPLPVRLQADKYREPDLVFLRSDRTYPSDGQPEGADLVVEVVSEGSENRRRDLETKRQEYAKAGIAEYWIVDPAQECITVLTLTGTGADATYREHGVFGSAESATSVLLAGFSVDVAAVFRAAQG